MEKLVEKEFVESSGKSSTEGGLAEAIQLAKEHVYLAAGILRKLGPGEERVAWLLEDALNYLDDVALEEHREELPTEILEVLQKAGRG